MELGELALKPFLVLIAIVPYRPILLAGVRWASEALPRFPPKTTTVGLWMSR